MAVIVAVMLVLAACSGAAEEAGSSADAEPTPRADRTAGSTGGAYPFLDRALAGEFDSASVEVLVAWFGPEAEAFEATLAPFIESTGIEVVVEPTSDYDTVLATRIDGGNPPDIAPVPQPGLVRQLASEGHLVDLSDWFNVDQLSSDYLDSFMELSSYDDGLYGVWFTASLKSIVWYSPAAFDDAGYEVPETWDEMIALSEQVLADTGEAPWCVGIEDGEFSGWVATDWLEDILLRTASPETYDQWVAHEISFDHTEVVEAAEHMADVWFRDDFVFGGATGINSISFSDAQTPMFADGGPECWLHKQAPFITEFFPDDVEPGVDSAFFPFPPIDEEYGSPVLGAGEQMVMFSDRPEVRALMEHFATPDAIRGWLDVGGVVSPNRRVPLDWYTEYPTGELAELLHDAEVFRFDASDAMPAEVGSGTFWNEMVEWIAREGEDTRGALGRIDASWPADRG